MMKINSKLAGNVLVVLVVTGLLFPGITQAAQNGAGLLPSKGIGEGNFCAKIANNKLDQQIATKITRLQSDYQNRQTKITQKRSEQVTNLATKRARWATNREEHFTKMRAKAGTDAEKVAVEKFLEAVNAAAQVRRTAMDAAIKAFRTGVDQAILARRSALTAVLDTYYKVVKAALDKAKLDCAVSGADSSAIRQTFIDSLKTAKTKLQTERAKVDKLGETIQTLSDTKKAAMAKAVSDFKAAVEAVRVQLEAAFPPTP